MARESSISYDDVEAICFELLANGRRPARPEVQSRLKERVGAAGSAQVVHGYLNLFWKRLAERGVTTPRQVEGVPAEYVQVIDEALGKMVKAATATATLALTDREATLAEREASLEVAVAKAHEAAATSDQLRIRAEGELAGVKGQVAELCERNALLHDEIEALKMDVAGRRAAIDEKDGEIRRITRAQEDAHQTFVSATAAHTLEKNALLQKFDGERQAAKKAAGEQEKLVSQLRSGLDEAREKEVTSATALAVSMSENSTLRGQLAALRLELNEAREKEVTSATALTVSMSENSTLRGQLAASEQLRKDLMGALKAASPPAAEKPKGAKKAREN